MNIPAIIRSSADPSKVSLFVTGLVTLGVLFGLDKAVLEDAGSQIMNIVAGIAQIIAAATALYGLVRKANLGRWHA